jgi:hypothetical protein
VRLQVGLNLKAFLQVLADLGVRVVVGELVAAAAAGLLPRGMLVAKLWLNLQSRLVRSVYVLYVVCACLVPRIIIKLAKMAGKL